jgi:hypothetical protein
MAAERLADLIHRKIGVEPTKSPAPVAHKFEESVPVEGPPWTPATFETAAFNFLLDQKRSLGIRTIWRYKNSRIDGLVELDDGTRLGVEVKYAMNWMKACQACAQIALHQRLFASEQKLDGGLVVFHEFSGDWKKPKRRSSLVERGWSYWYSEHHDTEGLRTDLVRLHDGKFESFRAAIAVAGQTQAL